jgi:hypothetical protein
MSEDRLTLQELNERRKNNIDLEKLVIPRKVVNNYKEERLAYLGASTGKYPKDRLTTRDLQQAQQRAAYINAQEEAMKQMRDRMTQRDIETFQNDRTRPLPKEAYEQVDQELTYPDEVEGKKSGGMMKCKGGRKAIGGTKFTGVK